ncbi:hypothetical protein AALO_G00202040 [Alosa alosa]|uniref:Ig-like domain-containing protein n=1 Tax=Alosa alosa TaxID=278164 RepID=A0AAV6G477_9TELE|nr:CXADR-like membrane protein [Alosa sapidissima]XP_048120982.1 CXADR-like membrane protein [Alosa alosa]KAG5269439.1 hypothetical protein AALO_G00202040 [Alosa alosa]
MKFKEDRTYYFQLRDIGLPVATGAAMPATFRSLFLVLLSLLSASAQTALMKQVVGDNATLPCHHQFWQSSDSLDIEWILQKPNVKQRVVITFFGNKVYKMESEDGRLSFAGDYLNGDASLMISDLQLSDSGEYTCKVKTGGKYQWVLVNLIVLVKPSKPRCWMEGRLVEGSDVKLSCKSSDGSDPIYYKWERVLDKGKSTAKLPPLALVDLKNPEIVTLRNLTQDSSGSYRCTASNDVGEENCIIEVHYVQGIGMVAGAVVGTFGSFGVLLIILIVWLVCRKKEKKKYEEEETPNEIREDAEAPKAKLVKPNSLSSSRSGSSRSGASSTQSMVHNSAVRGVPRPRPPAVAALKENGQPPGFPQSPPTYNQAVSKTPEPPITPKFNSRNMPGTLAVPTGVMVPAQSKAFQTV